MSLTKTEAPAVVPPAVATTFVNFITSSEPLPPTLLVASTVIPPVPDVVTFAFIFAIVPFSSDDAPVKE